MCRSNRKESFWQNLFVFSIREKPPCGNEPSPRLKCSGSTLARKRPPGKKRNLCRKLIRHYFLKSERTPGTVFLIWGGGDVTPQKKQLLICLLKRGIEGRPRGLEKIEKEKRSDG
jgi:hypothetical protein